MRYTVRPGQFLFNIFDHQHVHQGCSIWKACTKRAQSMMRKVEIDGEYNNCTEVNMRDIKSAPKDGTHILGYGLHLNDSDDREIGFCEVYYYEELNRWYNITHYPSEVIAWDYLPEPGGFKI